MPAKGVTLRPLKKSRGYVCFFKYTRVKKTKAKPDTVGILFKSVFLAVNQMSREVTVTGIWHLAGSLCLPFSLGTAMAVKIS